MSKKTASYVEGNEAPLVVEFTPQHKALQHKAPPKPFAGPGVGGAQARVKCGFPILNQDELLTDASMRELLEMLTTMRPAGSKTEEEFIARWIAPLGSTRDDYGNRWVRVGADPSILFSCHTDTVHREDGIQQIELADGFVFAPQSSCLGADDTAGIWLMRQMILARVPGLYLFHREEECGGNGSDHIARNLSDRLTGIKAAIALDRKGYGDVITHQFGGRCCSDEFAKSLAKILAGTYEPDPTGSFTDTANYTDLIGECTNLSVGYFAQHGPNEYLDLSFVAHLRDALIEADWSALVFQRQPGEIDPADSFGGGRWAGYTGYGYGGTRSNWSGGGRQRDRDAEIKRLLDYIRDYPDVVAAFLHDMSVDTDELDDFYFTQTDRDYGVGRDDAEDDDPPGERDLVDLLKDEGGHA